MSAKSGGLTAASMRKARPWLPAPASSRPRNTAFTTALAMVFAE